MKVDWLFAFLLVHLLGEWIRDETRRSVAAGDEPGLAVLASHLAALGLIAGRVALLGLIWLVGWWFDWWK